MYTKNVKGQIAGIKSTLDRVSNMMLVADKAVSKISVGRIALEGLLLSHSTTPEAFQRSPEPPDASAEQSCSLSRNRERGVISLNTSCRFLVLCRSSVVSSSQPRSSSLPSLVTQVSIRRWSERPPVMNEETAGGVEGDNSSLSVSG